MDAFIMYTSRHKGYSNVIKRLNAFIWTKGIFIWNYIYTGLWVGLKCIVVVNYSEVVK